MKKKFLLTSLVAGLGYLMFSSSASGPGHSGYNCTGADAASGAGNPTGCIGSGCHGSSVTPGITVVLELDSAGIATSSTTMGTGHYKPGFTYTFKIKGTNTTALNLPKFGFQVSATKGSTALASPVNAGTLQSTGLPTGLRYVAAPGTSSSFYAHVVEHSTRLSPTTGTGSTGTTYEESITWTAPAAGTGTVSLWGVINAVNTSPSSEDAGDKSNTAQLILNELPSTTGVAAIGTAVELSVFPNPAVNNVNIQLTNAQAGAYSISIYSLTGSLIATQQITVNGSAATTAISTTNWASGLYNVVIEKDGNRSTALMVKQ
jgi:hypothetical protein